MIGDDAWLQTTFLETVQKRGAAVIDKRGASSAASAAHAAIDSVNSVVFATPGDDWHSLAVCSSGEYGVPEGLQFGFPVRSDGSSWTVVEGIEHDEFAKGKIAITTQELRRRARRGPRARSPRELTLARYALAVRRDGEPPNGDISLTLDSARGAASVRRGARPRAPTLGARCAVPRRRRAAAAPAADRSSRCAPTGCGRRSSTRPTTTGASGSRRSGCASTTVAEARTSDVGERVPVGYDLEWDRGRVVGELLVGRARIPVDTTGTFTHTP